MAVRRPLGFELAVVTVLALAYFSLGLGHYSLVDPWETHYAEVSRRMLEERDWIHTQWQAEGFRSKPPLTFWAIASSLRLHGLAADGGYPGEMADRGDEVTAAVRLPFTLFAVLGVALTWLALARLVNRRVAYIAVVAIATCPLLFLVARQAITDITVVGPLLGAMALFLLATEDGDRPITTWRGRLLGVPWRIDARHLFGLVIGGLVAWQAGYALWQFARDPVIARGLRVPVPGLFVALAAVVPWSVPWILTRARALAPLRTMRQVFMLWFYALLGVSVLGKGLPALGLAGIVCLVYVAVLNDWRRLWHGRYEIIRGIFLIAAIAVPWHLGMYFKDGLAFTNEYFGTHLFGRVAVGVFGERGTFDFYLSQLGLGMFLWAGLIPGALAAALRFTNGTTRDGRVRLVYAIWGVAAVAFFALMQTKFHHYILPALPPLAVLIGFWLDDVATRRIALHWLWLALGVGSVILLTRDLLFEEKQWIEMFVFRYDRPWPTAAPWSIDISDGLLGVGAIACAGLCALGWLQRRPTAALAGLSAAALGTSLWTMHIYMPIAGTHWGQRESVAAYYREREIYGARTVYFGGDQMAHEWSARIGAAYAGRDTAVWVDTAVPDRLVVDQPASLRIDIHSAAPNEERKPLWTATVTGRVSRISATGFALTIPATELTALASGLSVGRGANSAGARPPLRVVDADRLLVWNGYWRGEVFWSSNEIYGWLPEMKTDWQLDDGDGKKLASYLSDRERAPLGRRYYVITSANPSGLRGILPTARAKETLETIDQTSNKFWLARFEL